MHTHTHAHAHYCKAIEMVATNANVDPAVVQHANMDQVVAPIMLALQKQADVADKKAAVAAFNAANKWRKRGLYCMPVHYSMNNSGFEESALVEVHSDGSVSVNNSGLEVGQGINTKVEQATVFELSKTAPFGLDMVTTVLPKSTRDFDASPTWASGTSETCVYATLQACAEINKALAKHRVAGDTWVQVVAKAAKAGAKLSATGRHVMGTGGAYPICSAACAVVEIDVLTGEHQILSADILYDAGRSLNPYIDIGQVEGCFVQAAGMCLTEEQTRSPVDGRLISNGTWDYKPPCALDIPIEFNVHFLDSENDSTAAVLGSKATGEPAYLLGPAAFFALKQAVYAARAEAGDTSWFQLNTPASPERVHAACSVKL